MTKFLTMSLSLQPELTFKRIVQNALQLVTATRMNCILLTIIFIMALLRMILSGINYLNFLGNPFLIQVGKIYALSKPLQIRDMKHRQFINSVKEWQACALTHRKEQAGLIGLHVVDLQKIIREEYLSILETEIAKAFITAYEEQAQSLFDSYLDNAEGYTTKTKFKRAFF